MSNVLDVMPAKIIDRAATLLYYIAEDHLYVEEGKRIQGKLLAYFGELLFTFEGSRVGYKIPVLEGDTLRDYNTRLNTYMADNCPAQGGIDFTITYPTYDEPVKFHLRRNEVREPRISMYDDSSNGKAVSNALGMEECINTLDLLYTRGTSKKLYTRASLVEIELAQPSRVNVKVSNQGRNELETVITYDVNGMTFKNLDELFIKVAATVYLSNNSIIKDANSVVFQAVPIDDSGRQLPVLECHRSYSASRPGWLKSICFM